MAVQARIGSTQFDSTRYRGLRREDLIRIYRLMVLSRRLDDREIQLKRQNRIFFQISGAGHEAVNVAAGLALRAAYDWFLPYYRDRALCLALGITPYDMLLQAVGAHEDPSSGGRQMPSHWGNHKLNIVSRSSAVGTQFLEAIGMAEASLYYERYPRALELARHAPLGEDVRHQPDEVVLVAGGEGSTSEGEFFESLNTACLKKLPVLYLIEDNKYAISAPVAQQTAGGSISRLIENFPGLLVQECDGTEPLESYDAMCRAAAYCRERKGPALVHAHVTRPYSHSLSDDDKLYKTGDEREEEAHRDPIPKFGLFLVREGIAVENEIEAIEAEIDREVRAASDRALAAAPPHPDSILVAQYSPDVDPTSARFATEPQFAGKPVTMVEMVSATLADEMSRDDRVVVFGEDVADCGMEENIGKVKGKGGVFKATAGLQKRHGAGRVFNTQLAEANIVGRALGMALRGLKPVAEIQFFDYIWPAMMQIRDELTMLRWRSNNAFTCPVVIRVPIGGYLAGGAIYHSQSGESIFTHLPGLRVVMPSTGLDANGLLRTAIRCDDPVLFLEPKHLYRQTHNRAPYPGPDYMIPFGKAKLVREGTSVTIVTYGSLVIRAVQAAKTLEQDGIQPEILDLRSLNPYDWELIAASVKKTNRVLVLHEDNISWGYGAEIVARIADELFAFLDAPVRRLAGKDVFIPYHPAQEDAVLPQPADIVEAVRALAAY